MTKNKGIVVVSGGFDPLHGGHLRLLTGAKKLGKKLWVILNNDNWLEAKKGYVFMPQNQRRDVLMALRMVDKVLITSHKKNDEDRSVCKMLETLRPEIFANGGDRTSGNIPEYETCKRLGIQMAFNVGGSKQESSSELVARAKSKKE